MPNLLKTSPVDTGPPVVVLPPYIVEFDFDGVLVQHSVYENIHVVNLDTEEEPGPSGVEEISSVDPTTPVSTEQTGSKGCNSTPTKTGRRGKVLKRNQKKGQSSQSGDCGLDRNDTKSNSQLKKSTKEDKSLPVACIRVLEDYKLTDAPARPNAAYIRYIERTPEELADVVEYDLDEEDLAWLSVTNERRQNVNLVAVSPECLEGVLDKLEKESCYKSSGLDQGPYIDDDAVCCICMDGECQNANAILFCDMCNLAVHQECYGVPYIPEGQWLCRRCFFSPSRPVECVLCPNLGGAFKQTECKRWAHVVCAIWIPEVCFANTVFLEPIDNISTIPKARWSLTCFICKTKKHGACIQCFKQACTTAFHVTCAQSAGLCMRMDVDNDRGVKKKAWCPTHAPKDFISERDSNACTEKLANARKILAEKRSAPPIVLLPTISSEVVAEISSTYGFKKKDPFLEKAMAYWKLKRISRNGVPLIRRLQTTSSSGAKASRKGDPSQGELNRKNYNETLRVRQDLEKGRLLCELTRKREKMKREFIHAKCNEWDLRIQPFNHFLASIIDDLVTRDTQCIFTQPVDPELVPDYLNVVKTPIDLSTMKSKIFDFSYETIDDLQADFELMIRNCMQYNSKDTLFYRAASRMQEMGGIVFREAKRKHDRMGFLPGGIMSDKAPVQYHLKPRVENDSELANAIDSVLEDKGRHELSFDEHIRILQEILDKSLDLSNVNSRKKKFVKIKTEIYRLKKLQRAEEEDDEESVGGARDMSSMDEDETAPPSLLGTDMVESSDIGDDGGESGASGARFNMRRRLRSTDNNDQVQPQSLRPPNLHVAVTARLSRRMSRSSESLVGASAPQIDSMSVENNIMYNAPPRLTPSVPYSSVLQPRGRGRPRKFLSQLRGRGRGGITTGEGLASSPASRRPSTVQSLSTRAKRGNVRGRPPKSHRNLRRPLRRSVRVDNIQKQQHSAKSPDKDVSGSSRQVSPNGRSVSPGKSNRSSRHVSPTLPSPIRSLPVRSSVLQNVRTVPRNKSPGRNPSKATNLHNACDTSLSNSSPVRPTQGNKRPPREPSPILGSPLKPHQLYMIQKAVNQKRLLEAQANQKISLPQHPIPASSSFHSARGRGRGRPPRSGLTTNRDQYDITGSRVETLSPKSMEAAAKSIVCEDRLSSTRNPRTVSPRMHNRGSPNRCVRKLHLDGNDDNTGEEIYLTSNRQNAGAISHGIARNSSGRGSALLQNVDAARKSSSNNASPFKRLKGPAGAVGRRRKSMGSDLNGPLTNATSTGRSDSVSPEKRKGISSNSIVNGGTSITPGRGQTSRQTTSPGKNRPKRTAAIHAAKSMQSTHHNNNSVIGGSTGSAHHHSHQSLLSFSVYRSGGDHDINSSDAESLNDDDDEVEEEEDDEDEDDEDEDEEEEEEDDEDGDDDEDEEEEHEGKNIRKQISASEDEDEETGDGVEDEKKEDSVDHEEEELDDTVNVDNLELRETRFRDIPRVVSATKGFQKHQDLHEGSSGDEQEINDSYEIRKKSHKHEASGGSTDSDDSGSSALSSSTITSATSIKSKESSSSSITTPKHMSPSEKQQKVVRRRRRSSGMRKRSQPAILSSLASLSSSMPTHSTGQQPPSYVLYSPNLNNNNVLYTNKEKDIDKDEDTSSSSGTSDQASTINGSNH